MESASYYRGATKDKGPTHYEGGRQGKFRRAPFLEVALKFRRAPHKLEER